MKKYYQKLVISWSDALPHKFNPKFKEAIFDQRQHDKSHGKHANKDLEIVDKSWRIDFKYKTYSLNSGYQGIHYQKYKIDWCKQLQKWKCEFFWDDLLINCRINNLPDQQSFVLVDPLQNDQTEWFQLKIHFQRLLSISRTFQWLFSHKYSAPNLHSRIQYLMYLLPFLEPDWCKCHSLFCSIVCTYVIGSIL